MVSDTLTGIENWFKEPTSDSERPKLLSKLAIIEFCGWLEEWMDETVRLVNTHTTKDPAWVETDIINHTHGFHYRKHFRPMLRGVVGEYRLRSAESKYEQGNPGDLELIDSNLSNLWTLRCKLAHSDLAAHQRAQVNINAPSWTKNQYRLLSGRLERYRACVLLNV
jgi:hypothetical protein